MTKGVIEISHSNNENTPILYLTVSLLGTRCIKWLTKIWSRNKAEDRQQAMYSGNCVICWEKGNVKISSTFPYKEQSRSISGYTDTSCRLWFLSTATRHPNLLTLPQERAHTHCLQSRKEKLFLRYENKIKLSNISSLNIAIYAAACPRLTVLSLTFIRYTEHVRNTHTESFHYRYRVTVMYLCMCMCFLIRLWTIHKNK